MKPITIIGGGLAGLTLGIALRQRGVPVTIVEAGKYPRHRVCGEFISGAGLAALQDLGLTETIEKAGARLAHHAAFFTPRRAAGRHTLPSPAICISRFDLDARLAGKFCELGGELRTGERWRAEDFAEGIVRATGRQPQSMEDGCRWFGLKVHARRVRLDADLEMHVSKDAYVGLCRLADGVVNVCGLFRRRADDEARPASIDRLRGERVSLLFARLEHAELDMNSFCAVAGLSLRPRQIDDRECCIGDALTMIPPITGNGMSMAFESARIALAPLLAYAHEETTWPKVMREVAQLLSARFRRRLFWAGLLHRLMFSRPESAGLVLPAAPLWRTMFALTR